MGVLLVALPLAAYHCVEHPMIRIGASLAKKAESRYDQREHNLVHVGPVA